MVYPPVELPALERWAAGFTDVLIAVSQENKQTGLSAGIGTEEKYHIIHSGIDPKPFQLSKAKILQCRKKWKSLGRPCVLVLSNFKKQKAPLDVVRVAASLAKKMPQGLFLWAGDGPLFNEAKRMSRENNIEGNIRFLGWRGEVADFWGPVMLCF